MRILILILTLFVYNSSYAMTNEEYDIFIKKRIEAIMIAKVIYCEARNQSYAGKSSVAQVILNRVKNKKFPSNIVDVIKQKYAFQYKTRIKLENFIELKAWKQCLKISINTIKYNFSTSLIADSTHFHSGKKPKAFKFLKFVKTIGDHKFYRS